MRNEEVRLYSGSKLPLLGFGMVAFPYDRERVELAIWMAFKMGYHHFDTAKIYGSEPTVGSALMEAIHDEAVSREEIFVTSKL
uniref:NADP-dependent oxidoreductase domain-containing protein n=1 Tax=Nelumbo nucifera TaxID=4432 RepID=A0A822Z8X1_NELNU|nr:TPA_asm: hypothetical protein HUJ06_013849 [Nelumbo nucifera]